MTAELHIRVHPDAEDPASIADNFPFEPGQQVIAQGMELIVIDLGDADDTTYVQDWYLNAHEAVFSFFIVSDENPPAAPEGGPED